MKNKYAIGFAAFAIMFALICTQITIFVIPPIGAVPEGQTIIIPRLTNTKFIDSADAICERMQGGVSLLCRGITMGAVVGKSNILLRLPYNSWLYDISNEGRTYSQ